VGLKFLVISIQFRLIRLVEDKDLKKKVKVVKALDFNLKPLTLKIRRGLKVERVKLIINKVDWDFNYTFSNKKA